MEKDKAKAFVHIRVHEEEASRKRRRDKDYVEDHGIVSIEEYVNSIQSRETSFLDYSAHLILTG